MKFLTRVRFKIICFFVLFCFNTQAFSQDGACGRLPVVVNILERQFDKLCSDISADDLETVTRFRLPIGGPGDTVIKRGDFAGLTNLLSLEIYFSSAVGVHPRGVLDSDAFAEIPQLSTLILRNLSYGGCWKFRANEVFQPLENLEIFKFGMDNIYTDGMCTGDTFAQIKIAFKSFPNIKTWSFKGAATGVDEANRLGGMGTGWSCEQARSNALIAMARNEEAQKKVCELVDGASFESKFTRFDRCGANGSNTIFYQTAFATTKCSLL